MQVKDIVKEVEDNLKTYSSTGMDISCQLSQSAGLNKFACKLVSLSSLLFQMCKIEKEMWNGLILAHEGPSDTRDTNIATLRLKFNAFKSLEGEKVNGTFTRIKCLLNDLENNGVIIPQAEVNAPFVNSLPRKWLSMNQTLRDNNSIINDCLATLDSDVEEDQKTNNKFMVDLNAKYHERALLVNQKRIDDQTKGKNEKGKNEKENSEKGLIVELFDWDKESVSSKNEETTKIRAFMAIDEDEPSVGKADARSGQWVNITMKKALGGRGKRKEKISSKEVILTKADEPSSFSILEITSDSESECIARLRFRYLFMLPSASAVACASTTYPCIGSKSVSRDAIPKSFEFNAEHYATLVVYPASFHKYPESFLCLVGLSQMDLLSFIRTAYPTKVRIGERQRDEDEPKLLETTVGRVVPLLPVAPDRSSGELEASVDKIFDKGGSGEQVEQGVGIQLVSKSEEFAAENEVSLQPRCQKKRKIIVIGAGESSHPPKKLREDHRILSGASIGGKSRSVVKQLLAGDVQNAKVRGDPVLTFPFVTSSISATLEREGEGHTDSITGLNLRTINAPASVPVITAAIIVTPTACPTMVKEKIFKPSLFYAKSASAGTDPALGGFADLSGSDFLVGGIRTMSLSAEVRMCTKYNIKENRRLESVVHDQIELLKVREKEIGDLGAHLLVKEAKAAEAIRLCAKASQFEVVEKSLQYEVQALTDHNATLEKEKSEFDVKAVDLTASVKLREAAIGKAVEKGMQDRLSTGITHGAEELKSNKDASIDTIMKLLCLEDSLANKLGLTESHPHVDQLMVPIHHSPDQRVVGAFALSLSLDVSSSRVRRIKENIANHRLALHDVFVPLSEPLSVTDLTGTEGTSNVIITTVDTTTALSGTFASASLISTDDYEIVHAKGGDNVGADADPFPNVDDAELNTS
nr:retrovirus-related Pol polyprotein from transposon TNT 1-94 [Tanacetum cinerariifolium]